MPKGIYIRTKKVRQSISESKKGEKNPMFGRTREKHPNYGKKRSKHKAGCQCSFCKAERGEPHKLNCECSFCRSKKGEKNPMFGRIGEKSPRWSGGPEECYKRGKLKSLKKVEKLAGRKKPQQCEVCGGLGRICFDHTHSVSKEYTKENFRGWICVRCNSTLGFVKDSPELLIRLADYLNKTNK